MYGGSDIIDNYLSVPIPMDSLLTYLDCRPVTYEYVIHNRGKNWAVPSINREERLEPSLHIPRHILRHTHNFNGIVVIFFWNYLFHDIPHNFNPITSRVVIRSSNCNNLEDVRFDRKYRVSMNRTPKKQNVESIEFRVLEQINETDMFNSCERVRDLPDT